MENVALMEGSEEESGRHLKSVKFTVPHEGTEHHSRSTDQRRPFF